MYSKFNYNPSDYFYNSTLNSFLRTGKEIYDKHEKEVQKCLSEYISENGIINGSDLKEHWFSISDKDIFISHSHKDINKVKAFAGWLYEKFGLEAFIDSCSWGYCDSLLKKIDDIYCYQPRSQTYNYNLRNYTTSHVHMMLATALTEMIDKTECVIFFNTPNSINMSEELDNIKNHQKTLSPWIYHELSMTTMLPCKRPSRCEKILEHYERFSQNALKIQYDIDKALNQMTELSDENLINWATKWDKRAIKIKEEALDVLYEIMFPKKMSTDK